MGVEDHQVVQRLDRLHVSGGRALLLGGELGSPSAARPGCNCPRGSRHTGRPSDPRRTRRCPGRGGPCSSSPVNRGSEPSKRSTSRPMMPMSSGEIGEVGPERDAACRSRRPATWARGRVRPDRVGAVRIGGRIEVAGSRGEDAPAGASSATVVMVGLMVRTPGRSRRRSCGSAGTAPRRCSARWPGCRSCSPRDRARGSR